MERHAAYFLKITSSMSYKNSCFQNVKEEKDHAEDTSLKVVKYARTPVMSTYLVAFVVGEFDFVEGSDANGVTIRVYTPKGREVRGQFALEVSLAKCITNFCQVTLISTITLLNVCLNVCYFWDFVVKSKNNALINIYPDFFLILCLLNSVLIF